LDTAFDVALAERLARLEAYNKHHYRPNSYLHKWWARRCGSTFRLILKHLVADEALRDYYTAGGLEGKVVLDPMMGGGTTLHEAIRLGANVIGVDLEPIPVLQARATLSPIPLAELKQAFAEFHQALRGELEPYFVTTCPQCARSIPFWFMLYGLRRFCACGPVLALDSLVLRQETDGSLIHICPRCHSVRRDGEPCRCPLEAGKVPLIEKGVKSCRRCQIEYRDDLAAPYYARYEPLVVVGRCPQHQLFFKPVEATDHALRQQAEGERAGLSFQPADFAVVAGPKSAQLIQRRITTYLDLFSGRQLLYLEQAVALLPQCEPLIRLNLALLLSTSLEFNSLLCGYKGHSPQRAGAIRHVFAHHAYALPYTALENNPLYPHKASGTLAKLFHDRIYRGRLWAQQPRERNLGRNGLAFVPIAGEVDGGVEVQTAAELSQGTRRFWLRQGSATRLDLAAGSVDYVVTDPPYFDSVQYSDLAAFFGVWLRHFLPGEANWNHDVTESAVAWDNHGAGNHYAAILQGIFSECHRVLRRDSGRFIFTFHHWNPKGWAALTLALKEAGFVLLNRYVVHAENPTSVHIANLNALTHDAILVCAPAEAGMGRVWERPERIDQSDSYRFGQDCATLLGWLLAADLPAAAVESYWQQALAR
jgi:putative DNA methylase